MDKLELRTLFYTAAGGSLFRAAGRPLILVKAEVVANGQPGLRDQAVFLQAELFVFEAAPGPFDENVVEDAAAASQALAGLYAIKTNPVSASTAWSR